MKLRYDLQKDIHSCVERQISIFSYLFTFLLVIVLKCWKLKQNQHLVGTKRSQKYVRILTNTVLKCLKYIRLTITICTWHTSSCNHRDKGQQCYSKYERQINDLLTLHILSFIFENNRRIRPFKRLLFSSLSKPYYFFSGNQKSLTGQPIPPLFMQFLVVVLALKMQGENNN